MCIKQKNSLKPKVSIVLPVYNGEAFVLESMHRILNQSEKDFELILIDDASVDNTCEKILEISSQDNRVKLLEMSENKGAHEARRAGVLEAVGMYIMFIDADDMISHEMVREMLLNIQETKADISICGADKITMAGKLEYVKVLFEKNEIVEKDIFESFCSFRFGSGVQWNKIYKRSMIQDVYNSLHHPLNQIDTIEFPINLPSESNRNN